MNPMQARTLALAGLAQAVAQVRRAADTGQVDGAAMRTALDSVLRIDAADAAEVFGGASAVGDGLRLLHGQLAEGSKDEAVARLALAVIKLERRFVADQAMAEQVRHGIAAAAPAAAQLGASHPDVVAALASLYAQTISQLRPRILVQGNPHYLQQASVVADIRALLLAALRAAVLWRQMGGSLLDFVFKRREMAAAAVELSR